MPWFRSFELDSIDYELEILIRRNDPKHIFDIKNHPYNYDGDDIPPTFSPLSSFQYLIDGIPQFFYRDIEDENVLGIIVNDNPQRYVWFVDSEKGYVTNGMFRTKWKSDNEFYRAIIEDNVLFVTTEEKVKQFIEYGNPHGTMRGAQALLEQTLREGYSESDAVILRYHFCTMCLSIKKSVAGSVTIRVRTPV